VFILEKQPNFGKEEWDSVAVLPGLLPFSFLCLVRGEVSSRLKQATRTNPEVACLCIGAGRIPVESKNQGRFVRGLNF